MGEVSLLWWVITRLRRFLVNSASHNALRPLLLSYRREATRRFVSLKILLSRGHSTSQRSVGYVQIPISNPL